MSNKLNRRDSRSSQVSIQETQVWSAPIPPPELLQQYNEIIPNGADRILAMAENQSAHRIRMESMAIKANLNRATRGQLFAFLISILAISGGIYLAVIGKELGGGILGTGGLVALASLFLRERKSQIKEIAQKSPAR